MNFIQATRRGFLNYVNFEGRSLRSEYWYWALFLLLANVVVASIDGVFFGKMIDELGPVRLVTELGLWLPSVSVGVRRLHDIDRSGWWLLIVFIPLIGALVLIYWAIKKGTEGSNSFGNNPLLTVN